MPSSMYLRHMQHEAGHTSNEAAMHVKKCVAHTTCVFRLVRAETRTASPTTLHSLSQLQQRERGQVHHVPARSHAMEGQGPIMTSSQARSLVDGCVAQWEQGGSNQV